MAKMKNRWIVLQHVEWEGPGNLAREAQKWNCEIDVRRLDRKDALPNADEVDGLIVMGGPLGAYEEESHPFLKAECELLAAVARRGDPVLGVCLGAQLLAKALGARVFPGHEAEIGFGSVELTPEGQKDPVFALAGPALPVFHWHGDTFSLPEGAVLLASSQMYANQAFRFGSRAYGLQFHVEPDAGTWAAWQRHLPKGLFDKSEAKQKAVESAGNEVIARFFAHVMSNREAGQQ
jgi:GMP synthase-like glutamine amidotransferase